ncbi:uncharacterized protein LOC142335475 [Convolutriloba macropyga]|uniref:uncharacterized protein LOC142335475 n=1 Tax=Convolutriloba macropyga TaxID=536237 RepID=UPI003F51B2D0
MSSMRCDACGGMSSRILTILFINCLMFWQSTSNYPFDAQECPCLYSNDKYTRRVWTDSLNNCYSFCIVKKCYAFSYNPDSFECDIYDTEGLGYNSDALADMDCAAHPTDPNSPQRWFLRTTGGRDIGSFGCNEFFRKYGNSPLADGDMIPVTNLRTRGFHF